MIASVSIIVVSAVTILLSLPLIAKKVPRNELYGFRTQRTMTGSEDEWYTINRNGGVYLCAVGLITLVISVVVLLVAPSHRTAGLLCTPIFIILLAAAKIAHSAK